MFQNFITAIMIVVSITVAASGLPLASWLGAGRLRSSMGSPSEPAGPAYRRLRVPRKGLAGPWGRPESF
jgi:hypothetical protein